jgi:hypothetical protein
MSDLMTHGVLRMPFDMWGDDPLDIAQRHSRYVAASDRIYELERELAEKTRLLVEAQKDAERVNEVREIWAGMEGIPIPETACESYLLRIITQMKDAAIKEQP